MFQLRPVLLILMALTLAGVGYSIWVSDRQPTEWTPAELGTIRSLWLNSLGPLPENPSNRYADDPQAAALGHRLFFDTRFSSNGEVSCASCHQPDLFFADGLPVSVGVGVSNRNSMSLLGSAYSPWYFWNGRKDSLWSQALAPLENDVEHGSSRRQIVDIVLADETYREAYARIFGPLPSAQQNRVAAPGNKPAQKNQDAGAESSGVGDDTTINRIFSNLGKALEAYQRLLQPGPSRFDLYVSELLSDSGESQVLTAREVRGLRLFISDAQCINCHNGPLFTNNSFHNTAVLPAPSELPSKGRYDAISILQSDPFTCIGNYSDAQPSECAEFNFMLIGDEQIGAHRTPSLRNVAHTAPYMHNGQMLSLGDVLRQYREAPDALVGHNEAKPLDLSDAQLDSLEAFLHTLSGPPATDAIWLSPPADRPPQNQHQSHGEAGTS